MTARMISSEKLLDWIENCTEADGFWNGDGETAFDALTDAIETGVLDPDDPNKIKTRDKVILQTAELGIITDIQYVHNRYQLRGVSGWQYGIDQIKKV